MICSSDMAERAYAEAEGALLSHTDDAGLTDGVAALDEYRRAYEAVRAELLDAYPELEGPLIGDLLGEAAGNVWPSIIHDL